MAGIELFNWNDISDKSCDTLVLGNGASISINSSFNYSSLFASAVSAGLIVPEVEKIFKHFDTDDFEHILRIILNAHDVNLALSIEDNKTEKVYELVQNALIQVVQKIHISYDDVFPHFPKIANFLEQFDTIISLNYDLILYWTMLWANSRDDISTYFKDCFIKNGKFESEWGWLRNRIHGRDSTLVFYPHGNLAIATNFEGETIKIIRGSKIIEVEGDIVQVRSGANLMDSIQEAWIKEKCIPLFVSEGKSESKLRAIQRNSYLNSIYETVLPQSHPTITVYGWSMGDNDDHILSKLVSRNSQNIAISIYKKDDDWGDKAFAMRKKVLKTYKQKHLDPPDEIIFYDSASQDCWNN